MSPAAPAAGGTAVPSLAGTGRLADDLYLIVHHDVTGRSRLQPRAAGLGLAGGLLAELLLAGRIAVRPRAVTVIPGADPVDHLARRILGQAAAENGQHSVGDWLEFLSGTAVGGVAERLGGAGYLSHVSRRWPFRARWVPPDPTCAFAAVNRGCAALRSGRRAGLAGGVLAGLAGACGLGSLLMQYAPDGARRPEDAAVLLPSALQYLIAQTRAAVDSAVLTQQT